MAGQGFSFLSLPKFIANKKKLLHFWRSFYFSQGPFRLRLQDKLRDFPPICEQGSSSFLPLTAKNYPPTKKRTPFYNFLEGVFTRKQGALTAAAFQDKKTPRTFRPWRTGFSVLFLLQNYSPTKKKPPSFERALLQFPDPFGCGSDKTPRLPAHLAGQQASRLSPFYKNYRPKQKKALIFFGGKLFTPGTGPFRAWRFRINSETFPAHGGTGLLRFFSFYKLIAQQKSPSFLKELKLIGPLRRAQETPRKTSRPIADRAFSVFSFYQISGASTKKAFLHFWRAYSSTSGETQLSHPWQHRILSFCRIAFKTTITLNQYLCKSFKKSIKTIKKGYKKPYMVVVTYWLSQICYFFI